MSRNELEQVRSVQKQKMETMERGLPNGKDAVKAMRWLQDNRGKFTLSLYDHRWLCSRKSHILTSNFTFYLIIIAMIAVKRCFQNDKTLP